MRAATDTEIAGVVPAGEQPLINVGCGEDATVADTAALVREVLDSDARIEWDAAKRSLLEALVSGKKAGLENHPIMARTYVHLGAVYITV